MVISHVVNIETGRLNVLVIRYSFLERASNEELVFPGLKRLALNLTLGHQKNGWRVDRSITTFNCDPFTFKMKDT